MGEMTPPWSQLRKIMPPPPRFPLTWIEDQTMIARFNFDYLTLTKGEIVQFLDEFQVMSFCTMIQLNQGNDNDINQYLCKFKTIVTLSFLGLFNHLVTYNFTFTFYKKNAIHLNF